MTTNTDYRISLEENDKGQYIALFYKDEEIGGCAATSAGVDFIIDQMNAHEMEKRARETTTLSFRTDHETTLAVDRHAKENGLTRSGVLLRAVSKYLDGKREPSRPVARPVSPGELTAVRVEPVSEESKATDQAMYTIALIFEQRFGDINPGEEVRIEMRAPHGRAVWERFFDDVDGTTYGDYSFTPVKP